MEYREFLARVRDLEFIEDEETADQVVKSVLSIFAGRMAEPEARKLTGELPKQLSYEKLRGAYRETPDINAEDYVRELGDQFNLRDAESRRAIRTVFEATKESLGKETLDELEKNVPEDWAFMLKSA
jgi:uncharacterized protein (DUF2267 family)